MYLFVFIFILVSVLGLYTQIYTLQAARVFANQRAIGQIMQTWAGSAFALARANPALGAAPGPPRCSLTPGLTPPAACAMQMAIGNLPNGYDMATYSWNTIIFRDPPATQRFVITYVSPPVSMADPIAQPRIGYTVGQIYQQLRNTDLAKISYGPVVGGAVQTRGGLNYTLPAAVSALVANGSVAIIYPL